MRAFRRVRYGSPDTLQLADVDIPVATEDRVLVRVHASAVNAHDWHMLRGKPYIARLGEGLRRPKRGEIGLDVAGIVEAVGPAVADLAVGDRVFGVRAGAFGDYVAGPNMVALPAGLSFEEGAALGVAGQTALQAVRDRARVQPGQRVLINGAGGGVGTYLVQIARAYGAEVTAVTSAPKLAAMPELGARHVIDYAAEDFTSGGTKYDVIIDAGGNRSLRALRRALTDDGTLVMVAPAPGNWIAPVARILGAMAVSRFSRQTLGAFLADVSRADLVALRDLVEAGKVRPVIDRTFPFEQVPAAVAHLESGRALGKVVVTM